MTHDCVACDGEAYRRLGLIGWTCRDCLEAAFESGDYFTWYEENTNG